ncbi:MAG: hypothetical protein HZB31_06865 [Nitrospirae bacterium]|nr:hypothetical protein [Nitrospirota bacterium]
MKKLAESIILQCIEDLWDRSSMHESIDFFTERGFSICATLAGMEIGEQVKLLDLVNCTISRIRHLPRKGSRHPERCAPSDFDKTTIATILTSTDPVHHHGIQL